MILELAAAAALSCQRATIAENSGNGPTYHVTVCTALREAEDARWELIVDGGPLQNGAVIIGVKVPR